ncbi:ISPsy22, transposase truncated [Roseobacter sp. SK209-2-6]|nr:ISPsy22, transposase truncated [Roseobacter sp. SK209-2-6]
MIEVSVAGSIPVTYGWVGNYGIVAESTNALFYVFSLEDHVPLNHLIRVIDLHLDLSIIRGYPADFYSPTGRPSIDPELMIRMLLVGCCFGIRSERRLCEDMHLNLAYRWFCRFDLSDRIPDHSMLSKNRHARNRELAMDDYLRPELCCDALTMAWGATARCQVSFLIRIAARNMQAANTARCSGLRRSSNP